MKRKSILNNPKVQRILDLVSEELKEKVKKGQHVVNPIDRRVMRLNIVKFNPSWAKMLKILYEMQKKEGIKVFQPITPLVYSHPQEYNLKKGMPSSWTQCKHWRLIESNPSEGRKQGYYRLTQKGFDFVEGKITIPEKAQVYQDECQGFEGDEISFDKLMEAFIIKNKS